MTHALSPVKRHAYLRDDLDAKIAAIEFTAAAAQRAALSRNADYARGFADALTAMRVALELTTAPGMTVDADWPPVGMPGDDDGRFRVVGDW